MYIYLSSEDVTNLIICELLRALEKGDNKSAKEIIDIGIEQLRNLDCKVMDPQVEQLQVKQLLFLNGILIKVPTIFTAVFRKSN